MNKPKNADKNPARDMFQTPEIGTEILIPFLPKIHVYGNDQHNYPIIWECAAGKGAIDRVLTKAGYEVLGTDINPPYAKVDFLTEVVQHEFDIIVTNPPFSLKRKFYERCLSFGKPFALLLPFDMCQWIHKALFKEDCQGIVPDKRINYITPSGRSGKDSSAQFHSFWLTRGLNLPERFIGVELASDPTASESQ